MKITPPPRSPADTRREAILDVAEQVFLEDGYAAASMSEIAARVGGSKGTLYNYFKSKEDLFLAYVNRQCGWQQAAMARLLVAGGEPREVLTRYGRDLLAFVLSEGTMRNYRLIIAEAQRAPRIGHDFHEAGPVRGAALLADYLRAAAAAGALRLEDPLTAAHQFVGLCQNRLMKARLCNAVPEPGETEIAAEVEGAVRTFLAAFGPAAA